MKKPIIIAVLAMFLVSGYAYAETREHCTVSLTREQFKNLSVLDKVLRDKYMQYSGFNGSADDMQFYGLSSEVVMKEIGKIDWAAAENDRMVTEKEEQQITAMMRKIAIEKLKEK